MQVKKLEIRYNAESLYKCFIFILVFMYMLEATSWSDFNNSIFHDLLQLIALLIAFLYVVIKKFSIHELLQLFILNFVGGICFVFSGLTGLFMTTLAISLLPAGSLNKILSLILKEETILFIGIVLLSLFGLLQNQPMTINKGSYIVHAFPLGFEHPNMLAAQATSIIFLYLCVNRNSLKTKHMVLALIGILIIFSFSQGRTSLLLGVSTIILLSLRKNHILRKIILKFLPWMYVIVLIILVGSMLVYSQLGEDSSIVKLINDGIFNGRIGLAYRSLFIHPITLFGKPLDTSYWDRFNYFALDNGQVMVLLEYGIAGFLTYFWITHKILKKIQKEKDIILAIITIAFLIWSMYEGTMYFIGKNFSLLFFGINGVVISNKPKDISEDKSYDS